MVKNFSFVLAKVTLENTLLTQNLYHKSSLQTTLALTKWFRSTKVHSQSFSVVMGEATPIFS